MTNFIKVNIRHIFVFGVITLVFFTIYAAVQTDLRQSANDPQIQGAEDVATELSAGATPQDIVSPSNPIDMSKDLDPFIIIFNSSDQVAIASGQLNGTTPIPPAGSFAYAQKYGEDNFTWQPASNVREAAVLTYAPGNPAYFVLVARSIKEIEMRETTILAITAGAWLIAIAGYLALIMIEGYMAKQNA